MFFLLFAVAESEEEELGSSEESGKDWDELEEEARKGNRPICLMIIIILHVSAQGIDERMINVHYYYYISLHFFLLSGDMRKVFSKCRFQS